MNDIKYYKKIFMKDGIVDYKDVGQKVLLVQKPAIDNALKTFIGCPVIITHEGDEEVGEVIDAYWDSAKGAYICVFSVISKEAQELLDKGYSISCTYSVKQYGDGGTYHNINYDEEAIDLDFENLAIVKTPRYQEANEYVNSIINNKEKEMKMFKKNSVEKAEEKENAAEENYVVFRGQKIPLEELGRVLMEEATFHKDKPVDDKTELKEENEEVENEGEDKKKLIDEVGGILKGKIDEELWQTVIGKLEKLSYEGSEIDSKDNACNTNNIQEEDGKDEIEKDVKKDEKMNKKENSIRFPIQNARQNAIFDDVPQKIMSKRERIEEANKRYAI